MSIDVIGAQWSVPRQVRAYTTLRSGGVSEPPYDSLNLANHVEDKEEAVTENRNRFSRQYALPAQPVWLTQMHSAHIVRADRYISGQAADGSFTDGAGVVCAVLTADCLPLFMCSGDGSRVGLFHVGWKGLVQGIVREAAKLFESRGETLAWLGPAIGPSAFEIGAEVKHAIERSRLTYAQRFVPGGDGKYYANLYALVADELKQHDIPCNYDAALCTYTDTDRFFSYRRSRRCGRMASVIWIDR